MRILIVFIFLITTVGCSKEPSLLDRCVATNSEEVNYYDKYLPFHKEHLRLNNIFISSVKPDEYYGDIESLSAVTFEAEMHRDFWDMKCSRGDDHKACGDAPSWEEPWNNYFKHLSDFKGSLNEYLKNSIEFDFFITGNEILNFFVSNLLRTSKQSIS